MIWHINMEKVFSRCSNVPINHLWQFVPLASLEMQKNAQSVEVERVWVC